MPPTSRPSSLGLGRILLLGSGDFACNLYWQSVSFFLLFFYTDVLRLAPSTAGAIFAAGAVIDGAANIAIGLLAERVRRYRALVAAAALPLAASFVLLFQAPTSGPLRSWGVVLLIHAAFRICYAAVNIPYAALSVRLTQDSRERGLIAGTRMLFGTAAALTVAAVVREVARAPDGRLTSAGGYGHAASGFALLATALLLLMLALLPAERGSERTDVPRSLAGLSALLRNRAFRSLVIASGAVTIAGGIINASVVYFFSDVVGRAGSAPGAIAWMSIVGAAAVPGWTWLNGRLGTRALWLLDSTFGVLLVGLFAVVGTRSPAAATACFCGLQIVMSGFFFAFWAMLPDTVEWGEHQTGVRLEALAFGVALVAQKLALGASTLLLGAIYEAAGYRAGAHAAPAATDAIRFTLLAIPAAAIALSALAMRDNPLRRGTHADVAQALAAARSAAGPRLP